MDSFNDYPVRLTIDYPERLEKISTFFRILYAIPVFIILSLISTFLFPAVAFIILFRRKYPKWWFDWNVAYTAFATRAKAYLFLLRDEYPSVDEEQGIHFEMDYPDVRNDLNRWKPLVKWFLVIPHIFILSFLTSIVYLFSIVAWFAILFTGKYPRELFNFTVGVMRWNLRVNGYAILLVTDKYPPFSF